MELKQKVVVTAETQGAEDGLTRVAQKARAAGTEVEGAGHKAGAAASGFGQVEKGLSSLERQIIRIAGAWLLYRAAFDGLKGADAIDDLSRSIDVLSGKVGTGAKSLEFFQSVQMRTEATTTQLMKMFDALAGSNLGKGGFNVEQLQKFVVELANAGRAAGVSEQKMLAFWEAAKRGEGARFDKDIVSRLGLNNEQIKNLDLVREKIEALSVQGEKFGMNFEIALKKIGDAWTLAFAGGTAGASDAYTNLLAKLTDPKILTAIGQIGSAVIQVIGGVGGFVQGLVGLIEAVFGTLVTTVSSVLQWISEKIAAVFQSLADATPSQFGRLKDWLQGNANSNKEDARMQGDLKDYGAEKMLEGLTLLKTAYDGTTTALNAYTGSLKTNADHLTTNKDKTKEYEAEQKKLRAALEEVNNATHALDALSNRMHAAFDIEEGETPLDRQLAKLRAQYLLIDLSLAAIILKQQLLLDHPAGVPQVELDAAPGIIARARGLQSDNRGMETAAEAAKNLDAMHQSSEKLRLSLQKVNDAIRDMDNGVKEAVGQFSIFDRSNFIAELPGVIADLEQKLKDEILKTQVNGNAEGLTQDEINSRMEEVRKDYAKIGQQFIKDSVEAARKWQENFTGPMTAIFTDLAMTGGKNFGEIAGKMFTNAVGNGMSLISNKIGDAVLEGFGANIVDEKSYNPADHGGKPYQEYVTGQKERQDQLAMGFQAAIGALGQTLDMFKNASKGQQTSVAGSALSFAAAGASIGTAIAPGLGTAIGAVVGALIGGIMAAIANAKAKKSMPFAEYGIEDGNPYVRPAPGHEANFAHVSQTDLDDMNRRMQQAMSDTTTDFIKLLIKLPLDALTAIKAIDMDFTPLANHSSDELDLLRQWSSDFNAWVTGILPKDIANKFKEEVGVGFENLGMTAKGFANFWTEVSKLDPKAGMAVLNNVADALKAFSDARLYSGIVASNFNESFGTNWSLNANGHSNEGSSEFGRTVDAAKKGLQDLAIEVQTLPFEASAQAAADLGKGVAALQANLTTFLNAILEMSKAISAKIADARFNAAVQNAPNNQAKQDLYESKYKEDIYKVDHWKELGLTKEEVNALMNDAMTQATNIYNMDPKGRQDWFNKQLDQIDAWQKNIFKAMGDDAIAATNALLATVQPAMDWFKSLPNQDSLGGSFTNLAHSADLAAASLDKVSGNTSSSSSSSASSASNASDGATVAARRTSTSQAVYIQVDDPNGFVRSVRASRLAR